MMDEHDGEEVIFLGFEQYGDRDLKWRYLYDDETTEYQNRISQKARKALRGAKSGDRIRIEIAFDAYLCPIRRAMRISGTDRENIRLLEARVESLEHRLEEVLAALEEARNQTSTQFELLRNKELLQEIT